MLDQILQRITSTTVLPESRAALRLMVEHDWNDEESALDRLRCTTVFEDIYRSLGGQRLGFQPFLAAWLVLRHALLRLDHLQDDDDIDVDYPPGLTSGAQYNLIFTYYVLATALLDDIDDAIIPIRRIRNVTRMWNDSMLWAASGQQRDLTKSGPTEQTTTMFSHYQEIIHAKAGAVYGLGFGGIAALVIDEPQTIEILAAIGQIYGTLLQFSDDFLDASDQRNPQLTLPEVYRQAATVHGIPEQGVDLSQYWAYIYRTYMEQMRPLLENLPEQARVSVFEFFQGTFDM